MALKSFAWLTLWILYLCLLILFWFCVCKEADFHSHDITRAVKLPMSTHGNVIYIPAGALHTVHSWACRGVMQGKLTEGEHANHARDERQPRRESQTMGAESRGGPRGRHFPQKVNFPFTTEKVSAGRILKKKLIYPSKFSDDFFSHLPLFSTKFVHPPIFFY